MARQPNEGPDLLSFVLAAHKASREAIQTFSCHVDLSNDIVSEEGKIRQTCSSQCWYSPEAARVKVLESGNDTDYVWKNGVRTAITRRMEGGKPYAGASRDAFSSKHLTRCDAYTRALFVLNVPGSSTFLPLEEYVARANKIGNVKQTKQDGKTNISVELSFESKLQNKIYKSQVEFLLNSQVNYLVQKVTYRLFSPTGGESKRLEEVVQFKECSPGIFFPEKLTGGSGKPGELYSKLITTSISNIQINQKLPSDIFTLRFPRGIFLSDGITGKRFQIDSEGNRISSKEESISLVPPSVPAEQVTRAVSTSETKEEPKPLTRWILPLSGLLLVVAAGAVLWKRWQAQR